jgi:anti-sigma factor RsiW
MNPQDHNHPDLTAYALGELSPADAEHVRSWLAQSPEARAEFERVQQMLGFLQDAPALPKRSLNPRQRDTVLAMAQAPAGPAARPKNVVPFLGFRRPAGSGRSSLTLGGVLWRTAKLAAAACMMAGAFMLGQRTAPQISPLVVAPDSPAMPTTPPEAGPANAKAAPAPEAPLVATVDSPAPKEETPTVPDPVAKSDTPVLVASNPTLAPVTPVTGADGKAAPSPGPAPKATTPAPASAPTPAVAATKPPTPTPAAPAPAPQGTLQIATSGSFKGFAQTSTATEAVLPVDPKAVRPLPVPPVFAGVVLASPMSPDMKPDPEKQKPEAQPPLKIDSWKAEIASCPWDPSRRLMRFVAQIPVKQPGIENFDRDYDMVVKFDAFHVQAFRLVTEKYLRPSGGTHAARFAWYEIVPGRNFNASAEKPVTIGTISIDQKRGAAPDGTPLPLVDRGLAWEDTREDFAFEAAMTGWNMLLNGLDNISGLNAKFILDLAEKNRGEEIKGERARFINVVKQAQRAVGM